MGRSVWPEHVQIFRAVRQWMSLSLQARNSWIYHSCVKFHLCFTRELTNECLCAYVLLTLRARTGRNHMWQTGCNSSWSLSCSSNVFLSKGRGIVIQTLHLEGWSVIFLQFLLSLGFFFGFFWGGHGVCMCVCVLAYTKLCNSRPSLPVCCSHLYAPLPSDTERSL